MRRFTIILSSCRFLALALVLLRAPIVACAPKARTLPDAGNSASEVNLQRYEYRRILMGVEARLVFYAPDEGTARQAGAAAFARINQIDLALSDYNPRSEAMRLCDRAGDAPMENWIEISSDLEACIRVGREIARSSGGAFDITIGPLSRIWREARRNQAWPDPVAVACARALVGHHAAIDLKTEGSFHFARIRLAGIRLDFGGIAKGFAADEALRILRGNGIHHALASMAGDIAIGDSPPGFEGWEIGIDWQIVPGDVARTLELKNCGISTSGDAVQYVQIDGRRLSHILDPRIGEPLPGPHRAVTIVAPRAILSDALATTLCILPKEDGLRLARTYGAQQVYASDD